MFGIGAMDLAVCALSPDLLRLGVMCKKNNLISPILSYFFIDKKQCWGWGSCF